MTSTAASSSRSRVRSRFLRLGGSSETICLRLRILYLPVYFRPSHGTTGRCAVVTLTCPGLDIESVLDLDELAFETYDFQFVSGAGQWPMVEGTEWRNAAPRSGRAGARNAAKRQGL